MADTHIKEADAYKAHNPPGSGCIVRCVQDYRPGHAHSHRWNAAERARGEKGVPYTKYDLNSPSTIYRPLAKLQELQARGNVLTAAISHSRGASYRSVANPFVYAGHPFPHNAHHIIPMSNFHNCIDESANAAAPNAGRMYNFIVGGLLTEPYNINGKPNMIVLPTQRRAAKALGLPIHTEGGSCDHPAYRRMVALEINGVFSAAYATLAQDVANAVHKKISAKAPPMQGTLDAISNKMYGAIVGLSAALRGKAESLDAVSGALRTAFRAS